MAARARVEESRATSWARTFVECLGTFVFMMALMFAFNSFSHGTQDLYPTFLTKGHAVHDRKTVRLIAIVYNIGALLGGILFGTWSERIGRRRAIVIAALLAIPVIPLWAYSHTRADAGSGRIPDAVHGAGSLGRDSGASERTVAAGGARHVPWVCLPAGQFAFVAQFGDSRPSWWNSGTAGAIRPCWRGRCCSWPVWWRWSRGAAESAAGRTCRTRD